MQGRKRRKGRGRKKEGKKEQKAGEGKGGLKRREKVEDEGERQEGEKEMRAMVGAGMLRQRHTELHSLVRVRMKPVSSVSSWQGLHPPPQHQHNVPQRLRRLVAAGSITLFTCSHQEPKRRKHTRHHRPHHRTLSRSSGNP